MISKSPPCQDDDVGLVDAVADLRLCSDLVMVHFELKASIEQCIHQCPQRSVPCPLQV